MLHKSRRMRHVEHRFGGEPIESLLLRLHYAENREHAEIIKLLDLPRPTYFAWWRKIRAAGLDANGAAPTTNGAASAAREEATA